MVCSNIIYLLVIRSLCICTVHNDVVISKFLNLRSNPSKN